MTSSLRGEGKPSRTKNRTLSLEKTLQFHDKGEGVKEPQEQCFSACVSLKYMGVFNNYVTLILVFLDFSSPSFLVTLLYGFYSEDRVGFVKLGLLLGFPLMCDVIFEQPQSHLN